MIGPKSAWKFIVALFSMACLNGLADAQTWSNYTSVATNWSVAGNWVGGVSPLPSPNAMLMFGTTPPTPLNFASFPPSGSYTSNVDSVTPFIVNGLIFNGNGASDLSSNGIIITSSSATGGISFQGINAQMTQNGSGSILFANGTATTDILLGATGLTINGTGIGHVTFAGVIGGTGNLIIDHNGTTPMFSGGQVFLNPGTANTFIGNVVLNNGNLTIGTTSPFGNVNNFLIVNGGTIRGTGAEATIANRVTLNDEMVYAGTLGATFTGVVNGNGGIRLAHSEASTLNFQNTNSGTGAINVEGQGFAVPTFMLSSTATLSGMARNAISYSASFGAIALDNTAANVNNRLNAAGTMNLNSGSFSIIGSSTASTVEAVSTLNLAGGNRFTMSPTQTRAITFTGTTLNRLSRGTFQIEVVETTTPTSLGGIAGTGGNVSLFFNNLNAGSNINGVLPYGFAYTGVNVTGGLVRYDVTRGVVPLVPATDYVNFHPYVVGSQPTSNYRINTLTGAVDGSISVNALLIETPTGVPNGSGLYGAGTLSLTSGVIGTSTIGGVTNPNAIPAMIGTNLALGGAIGYFHGQTNAIIVGNITGTAGFVKNGPGMLRLSGNNSGLAGGVAINDGNVLFEADQNLGAAGAGVTLNVGQGLGSLTFQPGNQYRAPIISSLTINRPLTIGSAGGGGLAVPIQGTTLNWSGDITGNGRVFKSGTGVLKLSGNNSFTGDLVLNNGTVIAADDAAMGAASAGVIIGNQATFQPGSSFATNRNFLVTGILAANTIFTADNDFAISGAIGSSQSGVLFTKAGSGNLLLTANNSINGNITIGDATAVRRPGAPFAQHGGKVTLLGVDGALSQGTAYTLNIGTTLHLDNVNGIGNPFAHGEIDLYKIPPSAVTVPVPGGVNQNRLASKQLFLAGGELKLTGNPNQDVFEHIGASSTQGLTNLSLGNTITVVQPIAAGGNITALVATGYNTSASSGIMFFRGNNLGGATGDRTAVAFVTAPTLMNGLLPQAFYANSATAAPQEFASVVNNSVVPFTAYAPLPASGSSAATTYSHIGALTLTAATNGNALKISNGTINLGTNTMTLGSATQAGLLLSLGTDSIGTTSVTVPDIAFGTQSARISVNNVLNIGSAANPVRVTTTNGLNKFGPGTLSLSSASVTGGGYQVSQGMLTFLTTAAYTSGQIVTIMPGATLDTNNLGTVAAPLGNFSLVGFGTVDIGSGAIGTGGATAAFGGSLVGTGTLIHRGNPGQTLNGNSPGFSGDVIVGAGSGTNAAQGLIIDANVIPGNVVSPGPLGIGTTPILLGATSGFNNANLSLGLNVNRFERDIFVRSGSAGFAAITGLNNTVTTIASNITLNRQLRLALGVFSIGGGGYTLTGTIRDGTVAGSLQLYGGQISLWGNNTYTGGTLIEVDSTAHAALGIGSDTALGTGPGRFAATFNNTMALRADLGNRTLANNFTVESSNANIGVGFVGTNSLTINGTFNLNTTATNDLTRVFNVDTTGTAVVTLNNTIFTSNGTAGINKIGGGTIVLGGANTFTQGLTLTEGVLGFGSSSSGAIGPVGTGTFTINGGTLRAVGAPRTVNNAIAVGGDFAIDGVNPLSLDGGMNLGSAARAVVVANNASATFNGIVTSAAGSSLTKFGSGFLTLTQDNTYTGNTIIAGGRLFINNNGPGSGTSSGNVNVLAGATLAGFGRISGPITVNSGGTLAPGGSVGTLTSTNNTNLATRLLGGANWEVELNHANTGALPINGVTHDYLFNAGTSSVLTLGATLNFTLVGTGGTSVPYTRNVPVSYTIATFNNSTIGAGILANGTTYTFNAANFSPTGGINVTGYLYSAAVVGNNLVLTITPVPEPATVLAVCAAGAAAIGVIRRRTRRHKSDEVTPIAL